MKPYLSNLGQRYLQVVRKYYFFPGYAQSMNIFRFLFCSVLLGRILQDAAHHDRILVSAEYNSLQVLDLFGIGLMSPDMLTACRIALVSALACAALGLFTRTAATVSWVLFILYMGTMLGFTKSAQSNYVNHSKNICVVVLWIISAAPAVGMWGVDGLRKRGWKWKLSDPSEAIVSSWATQLIKLTLAMAYFGAGYTKFIKGGVMWADGYTLQAYLLNKHLLLDTPIGLWLSEHYWLCVLLGAATLVLELSFFLIIFFPRLTWFYVFGALSLHKSIEVIMKLNFLPYFGFVYFVFLDWPTILKISAFVGRCWNRARSLVGAAAVPVRSMASSLTLDRTQVVGYTKFARNFVIGLSMLLICCVVFRIERWPLTDYRVYANRHHYTKIGVYRVEGVDDEGKREWLPRSEMISSGTTTNRRFRHALRRDDHDIFAGVLDNIADGISPAGKKKYQRVVVVRRTVEKDSDGNLRIKNQEVLTRSLHDQPAPAPDSKPPVMQAWYEQSNAAKLRR